jgi:hypothetical protein
MKDRRVYFMIEGDIDGENAWSPISTVMYETKRAAKKHYTEKLNKAWPKGRWKYRISKHTVTVEVVEEL